MANHQSFSGLRELRGSGYEIMSGEPDIIGWSIRDTADRKLGVVHDLLFDPEQQKVRYIIAHLKDNDFDLDRRKVLIPIGIAELHHDNDNVILNAVSPWQIRALPTYDNHMTDDDERDIFTIFANVPNTTTANQTTAVNQPGYDHPNFNYDNIFRNRQKDRPANKALGIKQRENFQQDSLRQRDYERRNEYMPEEEMAVRNETDRSRQMDQRGDDMNSRDRLIDRIRHMKEDLNQIERDLRHGRDI